MAEPDTKETKSLGGKIWDGVKWGVANTIYSDLARHAAADIGSTYQACLYNGWHTQSAAIESPEHISEQLAKDEQNKKT